MASYQDQGHPDIIGSELSTVEQVVFNSPRIELEEGELDEGLSVWRSQGLNLVGSVTHGKKIKISSVSFDDLTSLQVGAARHAVYPGLGATSVRARVRWIVQGSGPVEVSWHAPRAGSGAASIEV